MFRQPNRVTRFQGVWSPLSVADFRRLLGSNALWWQTFFMEMIVVGWLVLDMTNSAWLVALIGFCRSAPLLLLGFFAGPIAERFGRRRVIFTAQTINVALYSAITLLVWTQHLALWHLAVASAGLGAAWAVDWPARRALVPDLVGKARTVDAMLMENFMQGCSRIFGPRSRAV